jgi:plasmid stabilization system protein ParE
VKQARFTKRARSELLAQTAYYEALRVGLGARFRSEVEAAAQRALAFPEHGKASAGGTRRRLLNDFPFSVIYAQTSYGILIHAVADSRRLPEYWLSRL